MLHTKGEKVDLDRDTMSTKQRKEMKTTKNVERIRKNEVFFSLWLCGKNCWNEKWQWWKCRCNATGEETGYFFGSCLATQKERESDWSLVPHSMKLADSNIMHTHSHKNVNMVMQSYYYLWLLQCIYDHNSGDNVIWQVFLKERLAKHCVYI